MPIYVAGLYVQHPSTDANAILASPEVKLLTIKFQHDVSAEDSRTAWREGFDDNCMAPCHLDPDSVSRFLAAMAAMRAGDVYTAWNRSAISSSAPVRMIDQDGARWRE